jgi:polysaccharide export outer membrane protein
VPLSASPMGRELSKVSMPDYVIEPPDILLIDALRVVPKPPLRIQPLDVLGVQAQGIPKDDPQVDGAVSVDAEGNISLGYYGVVHVAGKSLTDAEKAVTDRLKATGPKDATASVTLLQSRGLQQIRGEHLVRPDGQVSLGLYGAVYVAGMTLPQAKAAIQQHLRAFLQEPEVSVDVLAFNSKVYYIVIDGAGYGQQVVRLPITGNETVLDAMAQINGLPAQASKHHIWVARPAPEKGPDGHWHDQILPVNWEEITQCARPTTNYQLMPGDRLYVKADALITLDNAISKITAPIERLFGITLLGNSTVRNFGKATGTGNGAGGGGGF